MTDAHLRDNRSPFFFIIPRSSRLPARAPNVIERRDARWLRNEIHRSHSGRMKNGELKPLLVLSALNHFPVILLKLIFFLIEKNDTKVYSELFIDVSFL